MHTVDNYTKAVHESIQTDRYEQERKHGPYRGQDVRANPHHNPTSTRLFPSPEGTRSVSEHLTSEPEFQTTAVIMNYPYRSKTLFQTFWGHINTYKKYVVDPRNPAGFPSLVCIPITRVQTSGVGKPHGG